MICVVFWPLSDIVVLWAFTQITVFAYVINTEAYVSEIRLIREKENTIIDLQNGKKENLEVIFFFLVRGELRKLIGDASPD